MTDDQIQTLRGLRVWAATSGAPAVVESIDAALALTSRRCGNCGHAREWPDGALGCMNDRGLNRDEVSPSDGCILGWVAKP